MAYLPSVVNDTRARLTTIVDKEALEFLKDLANGTSIGRLISRLAFEEKVRREERQRLMTEVRNEIRTMIQCELAIDHDER